MNIENYIESQYRELIISGQINQEIDDLYAAIDHQRLREILKWYMMSRHFYKIF